MILVIAPDPELRRSIEFLLEMEGLEVVSRADLSAAVEDGEGRTCTVIDEDAIAACPHGWKRVAEIRPPVVLLIDRLGPVPACCETTILRKPLLGRNLVDAVRAAPG